MENLKETGTPNLVTNEGSDIASIENEKRKELFQYIKEGRSERDDVLKKSNTFKAKVLDLFGRGDREYLKEDALGRQNALYNNVKLEHTNIKRELKNETFNVIDSTIKDPLRDIKALYVKKDYEHEKLKNNSEELLALKIEEEKVKETFKFENLKAVLQVKELRSEILRNLHDFFDEKRGYLIAQNIETGFDRYSFVDAKGFPVEVARTVNESIHEIIENKGITVIEDNPGLFKVLNETIRYCPDSLTEQVKNNFINLMLEKGMNLEMANLSKYENLIDLMMSGEKKEIFISVMQEKIEILFEEKDWFQVDMALRTYSPIVDDMLCSKLDSYLSANFDITLLEIKMAWQIGEKNAPFNNFDENMTRIEEIERERPGITKTLLHEFGIKEFKRYSKEVLIKQYDEKDIDGPYGIILYTNDDHNGAFDLNGDVISSLSEQTSAGNMMTRIGEFDSNYELIKRLAVFNARYGDKQKISYLLLGAHGSENGFATSFMGHVDKTILEGQGVKKIKQYFVENPEIILASCSTGAENGIGQKMSAIYDAHVLAPKKPTNVKSISVSFNENKKPIFNVEYRDKDDLRVYHQGIKE